MKNFTEILFEKRNKAYGAYVLRTKYNKTVATSIAVAFFLTVILFTYPVIASYMNKNNHLNNDNREIGVEILNTPKPDFTPPPPMPAAPVNVPKFLAPKVVDEEIESTMETQDNLSNQTNSAPVAEVEINVPEDHTTQVIETKESPTEVFLIVEEPPVFNGDVYEYIGNNLRYPQEARELGIQGKVYVSFVVEPDGSVLNVKVLRGIGGGCDEEAVRVIQSMPKWTPGKQRGHEVRVQFNIPVKFTLL